MVFGDWSVTVDAGLSQKARTLSLFKFNEPF